jgi:predicted CoA-binding protein
VQELIREFMAQKKFAVVGATDNPEKYGHQIVKNLKRRGYTVFPVNPRLAEVEGLACYADLAAVPEKPDVVDFAVPPAVTEKTLEECVRLGLDRIWLQPGSESEAALAFCRDHNLKVVHDVCVMMN